MNSFLGLTFCQHPHQQPHPTICLLYIFLQVSRGCYIPVTAVVGSTTRAKGESRLLGGVCSSSWWSTTAQVTCYDTLLGRVPHAGCVVLLTADLSATDSPAAHPYTRLEEYVQ